MKNLIRKLGIGTTIAGGLCFVDNVNAQARPGRYFIERYNNGQPVQSIPPDYVTDNFAGYARINGIPLDPWDEIATFIGTRLAGVYVWTQEDEIDNRYGYFPTWGGNENSARFGYQNDIGRNIQFRIFDYLVDIKNRVTDIRNNRSDLGNIDPNINILSSWSGVEHSTVMQTDDLGNRIQRTFQGQDRVYRTNLDVYGRVPEPTSFLLFGSGLLALGLKKRR